MYTVCVQSSAVVGRIQHVSLNYFLLELYDKMTTVCFCVYFWTVYKMTREMFLKVYYKMTRDTISLCLVWSRYATVRHVHQTTDTSVHWSYSIQMEVNTTYQHSAGDTAHRVCCIRFRAQHHHVRSQARVGCFLGASSTWYWHVSSLFSLCQILLCSTQSEFNIILL